MKVLKKLIIFFLLGISFGSQMNWAASNEMEYHLGQVAPTNGPGLESNGIGSIANAPDGSLWILNSSNNHLQHYLADGSFINDFDTHNECAATKQPNLVAIAPDSSIWVVISNEFYSSFDSFAPPFRNGFTCIQHFKSDGSLLLQTKSYINNNTLGSTLKYGYNVVNRYKIAIAADGSVWLADNVYKLVQHFATNGVFLSQFNVPVGDGIYLNSPISIAVDKDNSLWLAESYTNRLLHFKSDGTLIAQFGTKGDEPGQFLSLTHIALADDGSLWVADDYDNNYRIQHINTDGSFIQQFSSLGAHSSLVLNKDGSLWIDNTASGRIYKFVPQTPTVSVAEFDDNFKLLYLNDVIIGDRHFQTVLQQKNNVFALTSFLRTPNAYLSSAKFDLNTQFLTVPLVQAFGQNYQARFKQTSDGTFEIQSLAPVK